MGGAVTGGINPANGAGAKTMANMAQKHLGGGEKVILSGYSQGAEQVHGALRILGGVGAKIAAVRVQLPE
jgi:cutinase